MEHPPTHENLLERAVVLAAGEQIRPEDLALAPPRLSPSATHASKYQARLDASEREVLLQALADHGGDKRAAARAMEIALSTFYAKLKKHEL